ncbi:AraC family transcriptional regulator [Paracoccus denitrificans]|uniref:helix-turn-helix transcriptional regulator n=1 Tax=Paracoccus denitrificans TaxID=266 RepID=UPI001E2CEA59|nr:AraC family transcriptional regulator [Paracoccus denitrificans]UFS67258.1 AraC family transcriptional regulator [Paracoccus denitrificans]
MEIIDGPGIQVFLARQHIESGVVWDSVTAPGYWMGTLLDGEVAVRQSLLRERSWFGGGGALFASDEPIETRHRALSSGSMAAVFVRFDPALAPEILGEESLSAFSAAGGGLPDIARNLAWQMMGCRMEGAARRLYIGAKALELAAHALAPVGPAHDPARLTTREIRLLHEACAMLDAELRDPPALPDLARRVGLNVTRLNQGFRMLFGQPPYAWLKTRRLERAKALIESGRMNISDVARLVGYQPQHFATEFRNRFGTTPSSLRPRH